MEAKTYTLKSFLKSLRMNEALISRFLGGVVVVIVGILVYNYFSGVNKTQLTDNVAISDQVKLVEENGQMIPDNLPKKHKVEKGEYLWTIAEKYYESGYNWVDIAKENNLTNADVITEGQELIIPRTGVKEVVKETVIAKGNEIADSEYTVVKGDTLWKIAVRAYADGYQWTKIWEANKTKITDSNLIETGMVIVIPR